MTKRFHVCDDNCEPEGTGIHNTIKKGKKTVKKIKVVKKEIKPEVVNVYANKPNPSKNRSNLGKS